MESFGIAYLRISRVLHYSDSKQDEVNTIKHALLTSRRAYSFAASALLAVDHFNSRDGTVVPDLARLSDTCTFRLDEPIFLDSRNDETTSLTHLWDMAANNSDPQPCAILGPQNAGAFRNVQAAAIAMNLPLINYFNSERGLNNSPNTIGFSLPSGTLARAAVDYLSVYGTVASWSNKGPFEISLVDEMQLLAGDSLQILQFNGGASQDDWAVERLRDSGLTDILVDLKTIEDLAVFAKKIDGLGMLAPEYSYILPSDLTSSEALATLDSGVTSEETGEVSTLHRIVSGAIVFDRVDPLQASHDDPFLVSWKNLTSTFVNRLNSLIPPQTLFKAAPSFFAAEDPSSFSVLLYHAIVTIGIGGCIARPSSAPTPSPTLLPTNGPTLVPTHPPTVRPTTSPTLSPTISPTVRPTIAPSVLPSGSPTPHPTSSPTLPPTNSPTLNPTNSPRSKRALFLSVDTPPAPSFSFSHDWRPPTPPPVARVAEHPNQGVSSGTLQGISNLIPWHGRQLQQTGNDLLAGIRSAAVVATSDNSTPGVAFPGLLEAGLYNIRPEQQSGRVGKNDSLFVQVLVQRFSSNSSWVQVDGEVVVYRDGSTERSGIGRIVYEYNYLSRGVRKMGTVAMSISWACSLSGFLAVWIFRNDTAVQRAQPFFLLLLCIGSFTMTASIFTLSQDEGTGYSPSSLSRLCMATPWLFFLGEIIVFSALFTKLWRVDKVLQFRRRKVTIGNVVAPTTVLLILTIGLLTAWTVIDPWIWDRQLILQVPAESYGQCTSNSFWIFFGPLAGLVVCAQVLSFYFAWKTTDIPSDFQDSQAVVYTSFVQLQAWTVGIPMLAAIGNTSTDATYIGRTMLIWIFATSSVIVVVWPKVFKAISMRRHPEQRKKGRVSVTGMNDYVPTSSITPRHESHTAQRGSRADLDGISSLKHSAVSSVE